MKLSLYSLMLFVVLTMTNNVYAVQVYKDSTSRTNLSVFGRLEGGLYNQFAKDDDNDKATIEGNARLGVSASREVTTNIKALGFAEWEVASQSSENGKFDTRYAYVGMDFSQYGILVAGQGDTAQYITVGFTDVFEQWGSEANDYWLLGGRQEGQVMYSLSVGNYTMTASWQSAQKDMGNIKIDNVNEKLDIDNGYAFGLNYNWDRGVLKDTAIAVSYDEYRLDSDKLGGKHAFNVALSYGHLAEGFYTALLYTRSKFSYLEHHSTGFEGVGGYAFENGVAFMLGAGHYGYEFDKGQESYAVAQLSYMLNDSFKIYTEGKFGLGDLDYPVKDTKQHCKYGINMQYNF